MLFLRRAIAVICLAAILAAALVPSASPLLWALMVPLLLFIAALPAIHVALRSEDLLLPASPLLSITSSRAPPRPALA